MNVAALWVKRSGIAAAALREVGVPARVRGQGWPLNRGAALTRTPRGSCRNAITMASVMIDEIRLRAHARPLDNDDR